MPGENPHVQADDHYTVIFNYLIIFLITPSNKTHTYFITGLKLDKVILFTNKVSRSRNVTVDI